jgi:hypothetical protein
MAQTFTRTELYELIWSEPASAVAPRLGVSGVALGKACRKAAIPLPPRGYWARKQAGYKMARLPLPPREPGHADEVTIGGERYGYHYPVAIDLDAPEPEAPVFDEPMDALRARIEKRTRAVRVSSDFALAHPAIRALLAKDDQRREKQRESSYSYSWYAPVFDTPLQRRRLRILNAILLALAAQGFGGFIGGEKGDEITVRIGESSIGLELSEAGSKGRSSAQNARREKRERLRLSVKSGYQTQGMLLAEDEAGRKLETRLREAVIALIVLGEERYRGNQVHHHQWLLERRAQRIEDIRRQKEEAERKERERIATLEKARIDRLLGDAAALRTAQDIRAYVRRAREAAAALSPPVPEGELAAWTQWALAQADRIDPVLTGKFLEDSEDLRGPSQA